MKKITKKTTVRQILQGVGTEFGRTLSPNIWCNTLFSNFKEGSKWIITDMRFPNEKRYVENRNGITIRVERSYANKYPKIWEQFIKDNPLIEEPVDSDFIKWLGKQTDKDISEMYETLTHESETALDYDLDWDYVIINDNSLEDLVEQIKNILENNPFGN